MKTKILYIFLLINISLSAQLTERDIKAYPKFEEIVDRYFSNHPFNKTFSDYHFSFEKTPMGWSILTVPKLNLHDVRIEKLWDRKSKSFTISKGEVRNSASRMNTYIFEKKENYILHPFFGYQNYEQDVIQHFDQLENQSDSLLLSLAIIHGDLATQIARNVSTVFTPKQQTFRGLKSIPVKRSDSIQKHIESATTHYQNLVEQNKNFIYKKQLIQDLYALDQINYALIFESINMPEQAILFWHQAPFTTTVLNYANNVLLECDSNSILLSHNEVDTYPLLYLQKKGVRKDVQIINLDLLNFTWYRTYINNLNKNLFSLPIDVLNEPRLMVTQMQNGKYKKSTNELFDILETKPDSTLRWLDKDQQIQFIKSQKITYSPKNDGYEILFSTLPILTISNLACINIIHQNANQKTIHITDGYQMKKYGIHEKYIKRTGLNYTLKFVHEDFSGSYPIEIDGKTIQKNIQQHNWNPIDFRSNPSSNLLFNYTSMYTRLLDSFVKENKSGSAKSVIRMFEKKVKKMNIPAHFNSFYLISLYHKLGLQEEIKEFTTYSIEDYFKQYEKVSDDQQDQIRTFFLQLKSIAELEKNSFLLQEINRVFHFI